MILNHQLLASSVNCVLVRHPHACTEAEANFLEAAYTSISSFAASGEEVAPNLLSRLEAVKRERVRHAPADPFRAIFVRAEVNKPNGITRGSIYRIWSTAVLSDGSVCVRDDHGNPQWLADGEWQRVEHNFQRHATATRPA